MENDVFVVPAGSIQNRYWLIDQLSPGTAAYNSPIVMRLAGVLDAAALERALNEIVRRHEALRTTFCIENGVLVQVIASELRVQLPVVDLTLSAPTEQQREAKARDLIQEHGSLALDLTTGPLIQPKLMRLSAENHILAITTHQIISDGWSNGILVREIAVTYEAFAKDRPAPLPAPPLQYADFAIWHNAWLASEQAVSARDFWVRKLNCELAPLDLPTDRPRRPGKIFPGSVESLLLPEALMEDLRSYARAHSTTLYVALMGAFQILMKWYSRQDRFVITSSSAGRSQPGLEETFGRFAHPQIILADLEGDPTFEVLTERIQSWCADAWANQDFPLEKILDAMGAAREDFQAPELRAYFVFQKAFMHIHRTETVTVTPMLSVVGGASVDIGFGIVERLEGTRVHVEYNRELFDPATIQRLLAQYKTVLQGVVQEPRRRISEIAVLTAKERERLLADANRPAVDYSRDRCLPELIERQAAAAGDSVAVVFGGQPWTYRQLNERANQVAWYLRRRGLKPDDTVGICLDRSAEMVAVLLGVLKAGGAYVPLDATHPPARLAHILQEAGAAFLLTREKFAANLAQAGLQAENMRLFCIDTEGAAMDRESRENPPLETTAANLAYVIFTSGSTGKPKGVRITHRSFVNLLEAMKGQFAVGPADILVAISTMAFDIAGLEIFLPLIAGARTVVASEEQAFDPGKLRALLAESGATIFQATPHTWGMLLESGWAGDRKLKMLCGGEAMSRQLADSLLTRGGELWNMYGPTETTIWSSALRVTRGAGSVPIGGVIANTQFYVLNEQFEPVPMGVPGELYIGGDGLAAGYQNLPDLTRAKFLPNRFRPDPEARMYRTGDLVRLLPDGTFEFLGRLDNQVKIRGFRIELGEIESVLEEHPGVQAAVVVKCTDRNGNDCMAAYVTPRLGAPQPRSEELAVMLRKKLAKHMEPSTITVIERFPVTPSGKIDRKKLAETSVAILPKAGGYEPPRDAMQARLVEIWEKVLKIHPIGVRTSFFDLGGYSLTVVRLFAQINKVFDRSLPIATIFSAPTIEKLADAVRGETVSRSLVPIQTEGYKEPLFAVHSYLLYGGLRQVLGHDRPLYGLQERELDQDRVFRLEDRVETYVREIRSVQPRGPYHLIGWCASGTLTLEVARALRADGDEVALLGLIDASRPGYAAEVIGAREGIGFPARLRAKWRFHRNRFAALPAEQKGTYLLEVLKRNITGPWRHLLMKYWKLIYRQCKRFGISPPDFMHNVSWVTLASMQSHQIEQYDSPITLFRASEFPESDPVLNADPALGWQDIALRKVEVIWVPGDHESMFREPNLAIFGKCLKKALEPERTSDMEVRGYERQLV
jgi:amino acid adenylation domain-containing protein